MQSNKVARGSTRRLWSLPLMRSVIGTAPSMLGASAIAVRLSAATAHPVTTAAAAVLPMFFIKSRRLGSGGPACSLSSMQFPFRQDLRPALRSNANRAFFGPLCESGKTPMISILENRACRTRVSSSLLHLNLVATPGACGPFWQIPISAQFRSFFRFIRKHEYIHVCEHINSPAPSPSTFPISSTTLCS